MPNRTIGSGDGQEWVTRPVWDYTVMRWKPERRPRWRKREERKVTIKTLVDPPVVASQVWLLARTTDKALDRLAREQQVFERGLARTLLMETRTIDKALENWRREQRAIERAINTVALEQRCREQRAIEGVQQFHNRVSAFFR